jgi:hypothetical protein
MIKKAILLMFLSSACFGADAGFSDKVDMVPSISDSEESMTWRAAEVITSTGVLTCVLMTKPGVAINAGVTYYYFVPGQSILTVSPVTNSLTVTKGKFVHALWSVFYWTTGQ